MTDKAVSDQPSAVSDDKAKAAGRKGDWIQTFTGRQFWPLDPRAEDVTIEDIAHALSHRCRYGGHTNRFYSVAQHSVLVSQQVPVEHALEGLLHDAAEAYLPDVARPVKDHLDGFRAVEAAVEASVAKAFDLTHPWPDAVKRVDTAILGDEVAILMAPPPAPWRHLTVPPLGIRFPVHDPATAKRQFLAQFELLSERRKAG